MGSNSLKVAIDPFFFFVFYHLCKIVVKNYLQLLQLEPPYCKKWQKKFNQVTGLGNRRHLKALNDTKLILDD